MRQLCKYAQQTQGNRPGRYYNFEWALTATGKIVHAASALLYKQRLSCNFISFHCAGNSRRYMLRVSSVLWRACFVMVTGAMHSESGRCGGNVRGRQDTILLISLIDFRDPMMNKRSEVGVRRRDWQISAPRIRHPWSVFALPLPRRWKSQPQNNDARRSINL